MLTRRSLAALTVSLLLCPSASRADLKLSLEAPGVQASTVGGIVTETFNELTLGPHTTLHSSIGTYTASSTGLTVVAPDAFGGSGQTNYMATGAESGQTSVVLTFNSPQSYFGLYWSAVDPENSLRIYSGSTLLREIDLGTINGLLLATGKPLQYFSNPNSHQDAFEPFVYLNITGTLGTTFTSVAFVNGDTRTGFESDNHSVLAVPEPSPMALSIVGLLTIAGHTLWRARAVRLPRPETMIRWRTAR
jgi:hypothetical protein